MLQKRLAQIGLGKQSAKATPAAEAAYRIGLLGGRVAGVEISEDDLNPTSDQRISQYVERTGVVPVVAFDAVAMPRSIGALLLAVTGSVTTTLGVDPAPNEHLFTSADDIAYHTIFGRFAGEYLQTSDAKLDELEFTFDNSGAVKVKTKWLGLDLAFLGATPFTVAADADERPQEANLISAGGLFAIDGVPARVKKGSIKISNKIEAVKIVTQILPYEVFPGLVTVEANLTVVPEDLSAYRERVTGSPTGTTVSPAPVQGAVSARFETVGPSAAADHDLTFEASKAVIQTEFPEADPQGGPAEVEVMFRVLQPATGPAYEFLLRNDVAAY